MKVVVVIDVFRAATTACYVLDRHPASYRMAVRQTQSLVLFKAVLILLSLVNLKKE